MSWGRHGWGEESQLAETSGVLSAGNIAILIESSVTKTQQNPPNEMWRNIYRFECFGDHKNATINQEADLQIIKHILCSFIAIDNAVI